MSEKVERKKSALREEFGFFDDPRDTFEYIIAKTKTLPRLFDAQSGGCSFKSDADSVITRGIAALVCETYGGLSPSEILELDPAIFDELKIGTQLSPNRRNGLGQLCKKIADFAKSHLG